MATRRRSSSATAPKAPAKKRTTTRKVTSTTKVVSLNKSQPLPVIVTEETKVDEKVNTPELNRPAEPNISLEEYISDFKVRWKIHSYESGILWNQSVNLYNQQLKPAAIKAFEYAKSSYDRAFNEVSKEEDNK